MDDVFLYGLPVGEVRELLYQVSLPVTNHLISSNAEEREKYVLLKGQINQMLQDTVDAKTDDIGLVNKEIIKQANIEWQAAAIHADKLVLLRGEINDEEATRLFNQFDHRLRVAIAEVMLYHQNINQAIINKRESVDKHLKNARYISIVIIIIAFLVSAIIIIFFIKNVVIPLQVIEKGAMQFGHGDFSHRIEIEPRNELGKLAVTFNSMADKLEEIATRDGLTNLLNKKAILQILNSELARARRHGSSLSLMMLDLDYFKKINDTYGHQAGDSVLVTATELIDKHVRGIDYVGRYGGEEIVIVLPDTAETESVEIAERIRRSLASTPIAVSESNFVNVTVSIGIAMFPTDGIDEGSLLNNADQAMYHAKGAGRNRVIRYRDVTQ
ncbi:MAG: diguanylate cyclase [Halobacteria archaeon]|nr:diguanylate cyclase [Halobacteria archaeon]